MFKKAYTSSPPIFADLLLDIVGEVMRVDVEHDGWLENARPLYEHCQRVGLVHRRSGQRVWLQVNGGTPRYFSQVNGRIGDDGHKQCRTACVTNGQVKLWLHNNGTVEVGSEPEVQF